MVDRAYPSSWSRMVQRHDRRDRISSIAPERCPLAPETAFFTEEIRQLLTEEIRQLLYGRGRGVHRILFTIKDATVVVLHVRHGARKYLPG